MSVTIDGNQGISKIAPGSAKTVTGVDLSGTGDVPFATFRNKIINGDMAIDQEFNGAEIVPTAIAYCPDQWAYVPTQASKLTFQRVEDAPPGFKYSLKITVNSQYSPIATDRFSVIQPIEGQNIIDLGFGTSSPKTITISLFIKGSVPGKYSLSIYNGTEGMCYGGSINVTTDWSRQFVTLVAASSGVWATNNTIGLQVGIDLGSGSNYNTTDNTWSATGRRTSDSITFVNQPAGSTLYITGVQLEKGVAPTDFEFIPYDEQLRRCQRYFKWVPFVFRFYAPVGGAVHAIWLNYGNMRTIPTLSAPDVDPDTSQVYQNVATAPTVSNMTRNGTAILCSSITAGDTYYIGYRFTANARL